MSRPHDPRVAVASLLGLWVAIELLHSSRWLEIGEILSRTRTPVSKAHARAGVGSKPSLPPSPPPLRELLSTNTAMGSAPLPPRVWFAPYTTFPETGMIESLFRRGVYDTFLAFPPTGIASNYGAFKLSPADSVFAQASSGGLTQEAILARRLGYHWLAIDLGAIEDFQGLRRLCNQTAGCKVSGDGYALFRLDTRSTDWMQNLNAFPRKLKELPQISAAPRWGSLVFEPDRWWPITSSTATAERNGGVLSIKARPFRSAGIYRHASESIPPALRPILTPKGEKIWLRLGPGLQGADLCLHPVYPQFHPKAAEPCRPIHLSRNQPRVEVSRLLQTGGLTRITTQWLYGHNGVPITMEMLPTSLGPTSQPSAFSVEIETNQNLADLSLNAPANGGSKAGTPFAPTKSPP